MLRVAAEFRDAFRQLGWRDCGDVVRYFVGDAAPPETVTVKPAQLPLSDGALLPVFFKLYAYPAGSWRFWVRASKARREFENYEVFQRLGIRAATAIACGEERDALGRLRRAFILTQAVPDAMPLESFVLTHCPNRRRAEHRRLREALLRQLAGATRRIHEAGFFHHDLVWRNILVTREGEGGAQVWWIDCPRGRFDRWSPWRERRRLRDLASLDKVASAVCARAERVRFVLLYLGRARLDAAAKRLIRAVQRYRRRRWPEDWR
jgi:tRNA A-37 threonylcarbamoyl transferase component Bud32